MERLIRLRAPEIHGRATGGNVVNRRLMAALRRRDDVRVLLDRTDGGGAERGGKNAEARTDEGRFTSDEVAVTLVDSLRIADPAPGRNVLLAHYLHCVDPDAEDSEAAERERSLLEEYEAIIAPSEWVRDRLREIGISPDRVFAWTPGLEERFRGYRGGSASGTATSGSSSRGEASFHREVPRILTVASVVPGKHHDLVLEVADRLANRPWKWILVGEEELYPDWAENVRDRFAQSDHADRFDWRGVLEPSAMPDLYAEADLFVLPSRFETLGLAVREAMALGCPPVAFRTGGIPESVTHGETGLLAGEPGSADSLAGAVDGLLVDPDRRAAMSRAARAASRDFPDWDESAERLLIILDQVSGLPPKQPA